MIGVQASIRQSAGQASLSSWFESSQVSPVWVVPLPQLTGNVVELVEVLVLLLVVDDVDDMVGPVLDVVVVSFGSVVVLLVELEVLAVVDGIGLLVLVDDVLLLVELEVLTVVDAPGLLVLVDVLLLVEVELLLDVVDGPVLVVVLVVDGTTVVEVEEVPPTVLVVVGFVVDVVVPGPVERSETRSVDRS